MVSPGIFLGGGGGGFKISKGPPSIGGILRSDVRKITKGPLG